MCIVRHKHLCLSPLVLNIFIFLPTITHMQLHFSKTFKSICLQFDMSPWKHWEWNIWWVTPHSSWEKRKKKSSHLLKEIVCVKEIDIKLVEWTSNWNEGMMTLAWLWLHIWMENRWNRHALTWDTEFYTFLYILFLNHLFQRRILVFWLATSYLQILSWPQSPRGSFPLQAHPLSSNAGLRPETRPVIMLEGSAECVQFLK